MGQKAIPGSLTVLRGDPMAINSVRGFRRLGWVITLPVSAFIVLTYYENTKEFSPSNYGAILFKGDIFDQIDAERRQSVVEMPSGLGGKAYFSGEVPKDVVDKILNDFEAKHKPPVPPPGYKLDPQIWTFTVHKHVSKLKLPGIIVGSLGCLALIIQGCISAFAWIGRGFYTEGNDKA